MSGPVWVRNGFDLLNQWRKILLDPFYVRDSPILVFTEVKSFLDVRNLHQFINFWNQQSRLKTFNLYYAVSIDVCHLKTMKNQSWVSQYNCAQFSQGFAVNLCVTSGLVKQIFDVIFLNLLAVWKQLRYFDCVNFLNLTLIHQQKY